MATGSKNVMLAMETHVKTLDEALVRTQNQSSVIKDTLAQQADNLIDIVNVVATQNRLSEASLSQQYKYLSDVSSGVAEKLNNIGYGR